MGLRFRKSVHIGKFFRINISKSGVGYSFGVKGARVTKKGGGGMRSTLSIPKTGISYVSDSKSHKTHTSKRQTQATQVKDTQSVQYNQIDEKYNSQVLKHLVKKVKFVLILPKIMFALAICVLVCLIYVNNVTVQIAAKIILLSIAIVLAFVAMVIRISCKVKLQYEIDSDCVEQTYKLQNQILEFCNKADIWMIKSVELSEIRNKGNYAKISRIKATLSNKPISLVKTNAECLNIKAKNENYMFLPDMLLIVSRMNVVAISYDDIQSQYGTKQIEEIMPATQGAKVVGTTWQRITKSGEKDMRYSDNKQLAICEYGLMCLYTESGFQFNLISTNTDFEFDCE